MGIEKNIQDIQARISKAAEKCSRCPDDIKLVAVSKTVTLEKIIDAVKAGITMLGENRVQEADKKISNFRSRIHSFPPPSPKGKTTGRVEWHFIGTLQKNKARAAVRLFDLIHSVDSAALLEELDKHARDIGKKQRILIQVKLADESAKQGAQEKDLMGLCESAVRMDNITLEGLMTIPPFFNDSEKTRPYFRKLRQCAEDAIAEGYSLEELSMGMSQDFEIAIQEGSTMVRIGTAIFGVRDYTS
jgi:pyridoxal phosphate enzyme (YggS family)